MFCSKNIASGRSLATCKARVSGGCTKLRQMPTSRRNGGEDNRGDGSGSTSPLRREKRDESQKKDRIIRGPGLRPARVTAGRRSRRPHTTLGASDEHYADCKLPMAAAAVTGKHCKQCQKRGMKKNTGPESASAPRDPLHRLRSDATHSPRTIKPRRGKEAHQVGCAPISANNQPGKLSFRSFGISNENRR